MQAQAWYKSLQSPLQSAYVIFGEEALLRLEALDALRQSAKAQSYFEREVLSIEANFDTSLLHQATQSLGLFAEKKLIEIHVPTGKAGKEGGEALLQLASDLPSDTVVVLVLPHLDKTQQKAKWFQAWLQVACVLECKAITAAQLPQWMAKRLQQQGLGIAEDALDVLSQKVEGNLLSAKQEVDKLALLYPKAHVLNWSDVQQAVADVARFDVFDLAQAWMQGDAKRVLQLVDSLKHSESEPVLLLWAISEDLRALLRLKAALASGDSESLVRRNLRLWGDKYHWAQQALRRIGVKKVLVSLQQCALIDRQIKGAAAGDAWLSTQELLVSLCQVQKKL